MPIRPLVELGVAHPFFASGRFADARIDPDAATVATLAGLRLATKPVGGGLTVFVTLGDGGAPAIAVPAGTTLGFDLAALPADLATATAAIAPGTVFVDDGAGKPLKATVPAVRRGETLAKPTAGPVAVVLAGRPAAGTATSDFAVSDPASGVAVAGFDAVANQVTLTGPAGTVTLDYPVAPPPTAAVARIELAIGPADVTAAAAGNPRVATVALTPVAAKWCYHLVTNLPNPLADWRVTAGNGGGPAVAFDDTGKTELTAADAADAFGSDLLRRLAPLRVLRFVSTAPVAASETVARRVALFAGTTQLYAALPNPSPAALRQIGGTAAFGEVVRIVTA